MFFRRRRETVAPNQETVVPMQEVEAALQANPAPSRVPRGPGAWTYLRRRALVLLVPGIRELLQALVKLALAVDREWKHRMPVARVELAVRVQQAPGLRPERG